MSREQAMALAASALTTSTATAEGSAAQGSQSSTESTEKSSQTPQDDLVSSRIAQIAKKEAKYQSEVEAYKQKLLDFQEQKKQFDPFYEKYKQFEDMKGKDPVAAIRMLGFTDTDYINFVTAQEDKSTPEERAVKAAEAKIAEFEKKMADKESTAVNQRNSETISQFQKNIGITIKTDPEKFELCNFYGEDAEKLIYDTVSEGFQEDLKTNPNAIPMTASEAAELVEAYYEEQAIKIKALKKLNKQIDEVPVAAKKDEPLRAEVKPGMPARTLTNKAAPTTAAVTSAKKIETPSAKRERLIAALRAGVRP